MGVDGGEMLMDSIFKPVMRRFENIVLRHKLMIGNSEDL